MEPQNQAIDLIELVAQNLDPLLKSYNFNIKIRDSNPSIFAEYLKYERGDISFKITACLHPHDYPYSLNIQYIDKSLSPWKIINQEDLFDIAQKLCSVRKSELVIVTDIQVQRTIEALRDILTCLLKNYLKTETLFCR